jgi:hypothetical protein
MGGARANRRVACSVMTVKRKTYSDTVAPCRPAGTPAGVSGPSAGQVRQAYVGALPFVLPLGVR